MLVCPSSRQPLREATEAELATVNAAIAAGSVRNRGGNPVAETLPAGLVPADGAALYPIRDGIPILLTAEAIPMPVSASPSSASPKSASPKSAPPAPGSASPRQRPPGTG
ncbi:MAG: hypothetical protein ABIP94_02880 [Planctomycetota bacterium]